MRRPKLDGVQDAREPVRVPEGGGGRQNRTRTPITAAYENPTRCTNRLHKRWERRTTGRWRTVTGRAGMSPGVSRRGPAHSWLRGEHRRPQHVLEKTSLKVVVEGRTGVPGGNRSVPRSPVRKAHLLMNNLFLKICIYESENSACASRGAWVSGWSPGMQGCTLGALIRRTWLRPTGPLPHLSGW